MIEIEQACEGDNHDCGSLSRRAGILTLRYPSGLLAHML